MIIPVIIPMFGKSIGSNFRLGHRNIGFFNNTIKKL